MGKRSICNNTFGTDYDSKYWLVLDPAGILVVTFLYFLITSTVVVVYKDIVMLDNSNITLVIIFYLLYIPTVVLMVVSHVRCWWTNPGAVPRHVHPVVEDQDSESSDPVPLLQQAESTSFTDQLSTPPQNKSSQNINSSKIESIDNNRTSSNILLSRSIRRCERCNDEYKPPRSHHDSVSGRCIVKFDHYCPWNCNSIGLYNHKFFFLFLFYGSITSLLTLLIVGISVLECFDGKTNPDSDGDIISKFANNIVYHINSCMYVEDPVIFYNEQTLVLVAAVICLAFTCGMMVPQYTSATTNLSQIDRLQVSRNNLVGLSSVQTDVNEVFGGDMKKVQWHWFIPTKPNFASKEDKILGYRISFNDNEVVV